MAASPVLSLPASAKVWVGKKKFGVGGAPRKYGSFGRVHVQEALTLAIPDQSSFFL